MLGVNQCFGKHCSCHFQGGYEVGQVLEALYREGSEINLMVLIVKWRSRLISNGRGACG
jgi:hypothetical protein